MENRREKGKNIGNQSRRSNIQIIGVPEKEKNRMEEIISKITQEDFPELKDMSVHIERA